MTGSAKQIRDSVSRSPLLTQTTESGWTLAQRALRPRKLKQYLAGSDRVRLMIGSGPSRRDGWLATDILPSRPDVVLLDAGGRFPFRTASVDCIHTEHMIEHVDHSQGRKMLLECLRVLKPGSRIRIATPDFDRIVALAGPLDDDLASQMRASNLRRGVGAEEADDPVHAVNRLFSGYGHRFLYSETALRRALERAGFTAIRRYEVGESDDPEFVDAEQHGNQIDPDWNRYQTMVLEAARP